MEFLATGRSMTALACSASEVIPLIRERKAGDSELASVAMLPESAMRALPMVFWEVDSRRHGFSKVAGNAESLLGYSERDWVQQGFCHERVHPQDRGLVEEYRRNCLAEGGDYRCDYRIRDHEGDYVWVRELGAKDEGGAQCLHGLLFDVGAEHRAEDALKDLLSQFQAIFENALSGIGHFRDRQVLNANRRLEQIFGYEPGEMTGLSTLEFFPSREAYDKLGEEMFPALLGVGRFQKEFEQRRKDGSLFWGSVSLQLIDRNDPGRGYIGVIADIDEQRRAAQSLRESEERFRGMACAAVDGVVVMDSAGRVTFWNAAAERMFGYSAAEAQGQDLHSLLVYSEESSQAARRGMARFFESGEGNIVGRVVEVTARRKGGEQFPAELTVSGFRDQGKWTAVGVVRDITARKHAEDEVRMVATVLASNAEGICITDAAGRILKVNCAFSEITGYPEAEVLGQNPRILKSGRQGPEFYREMWTELLDKGRWQGEIWNRRRNGEVHPAWLRLCVVRAEDGQVRNYVGLFSDITQRKHAEAMIHHLAQYDALTNLPNRLLLMDRLSQSVANAKRTSRRVGILAIDLDHFKDVNDAFGHDVGDKLLVEMAERLQAVVRAGDTVARSVGDMFVIVLADLADAQDAGIVAQKALQAASRAFRVDEHELALSASLGIGIFPEDGEAAADLIKNAESAMFHAKNSGRANFQYYMPAMNALALERLALGRHLRRALERDEFRLHYQPQVDLVTGQIAGCEALIRWKHPELGMVSPAKFIPIAEETGLIVPIGDWVLRTAAGSAANWRDRLNREIRVAVNISARQFHQGDLHEKVERVLADLKLEPRLLEIELTESMLISDAVRAEAMLNQIKAIGVEIAVDDFGTGYSSLSYLRRFPLDTLKIDQSFVRGMLKENGEAAIVQAVIGLGHTLGMRVLAEGVETAEQAAYLRWHRCDAFQGYYFSPAVEAERFAELLSSGSGISVEGL